MQIVIIGAGNVATILAQKCVAANHSILQVINRNQEKGEVLAKKVKAQSINNSLKALQQGADFYIIAVSDVAILEVVNTISIKKGILLHTAASVNMDVLKPAAQKYGVLYPLQSVHMTMQRIPNVPLLVEGNTHEVEQAIYKFSTTLSSDVQLMSSGDRLKMHVAAVFVSNFTNHLYTLAQQYCKENKLDFSLLVPLIKETACRLELNKPLLMQTGPAIRNDQHTVEMHQQLLNKNPQLLRIYNIMTESIQKTHQS